METCFTCGNSYDKPITLTQAGRTETFDSLECAIHAFAPSCAHCGCRIIGHGVETADAIYCCAHCAQSQGAEELADRS